MSEADYLNYEEVIARSDNARMTRVFESARPEDEIWAELVAKEPGLAGLAVAVRPGRYDSADRDRPDVRRVAGIGCVMHVGGYDRL